jgi:hypothetical protein
MELRCYILYMEFVIKRIVLIVNQWFDVCATATETIKR